MTSLWVLTQQLWRASQLKKTLLILLVTIITVSYTQRDTKKSWQAFHGLKLTWQVHCFEVKRHYLQARAMTYATWIMIIIYTFDRRYIHVVKVSICSQCSFVSEQYSFILQRIFHSSHNKTRLNYFIEYLSRNRNEATHSATRSSLIHEQ